MLTWILCTSNLAREVPIIDTVIDAIIYPILQRFRRPLCIHINRFSAAAPKNILDFASKKSVIRLQCSIPIKFQVYAAVL